MMHSKSLAASLFVLCGAALGPVTAATPVVCRSPDSVLAVEFALRNDGATDDVPHYRVRRATADVIEWSRLGVDLADGGLLGGSCEVRGVETRSVREAYTQFPGKRRHVVGHANEMTIRLRETAKPNRHWEIVLRAYDDGV